ncbi:hypothetical protein [Bacillus haynesii]|uniref:Uncharacterized protein n=1 Tax=Bacillus haynesii TaxID=1925021 RepID=A0ABX3I5X8_9BACI|nr:hypothetical protein [Bacillus haynesii]MCI4128105.1 hypothetical protein [Bacillus haynesii]OMI28297.1 hypothetical protein BTA31_07010 [Bacillus haynesii]
MGKKTKEKNYSIGDHIFAILVVLIMCVFLISSPFLIFFGVFKLVALVPDVSINTKGTFDSVIVLFKFFVLTVVVVGIVDVVFSQILLKKRGFLNFVIEALLMFCVFYLYVLIYSMNSQEIVIRNNGVFLVSLFLFILYLLINVAYLVSRWLYKATMKNIQKKNN